MIYRLNKSLFDNPPWRRMDQQQQMYDPYNAGYNVGNFPNYGGQQNLYGYDRYGGLRYPGYIVPGRQSYDAASNIGLYPPMK
jgi:hypothetical protein